MRGKCRSKYILLFINNYIMTIMTLDKQTPVPMHAFNKRRTHSVCLFSDRYGTKIEDFPGLHRKYVSAVQYQNSA